MSSTIKRYGPYQLASGHLFYIDVSPNCRKTVLVHREVKELEIGRKLTNEEVVHHKNGDEKDNRPENLSVETIAGHARIHAHERHPEKEDAVCPQCGKTLSIIASHVRYNQGKRGSDGPFCGRRCAGIWTTTKVNKRKGSRRYISFTHGTVTGYGYNKCRCSLCREANRMKTAEYRAKKKSEN